jgi:glycolate oxidase FAD binding subunit
MVALGAAGPLRQGYGTPRDHVLGLTLVTGDGRLLRWGGRVVKNVAGFDLTRLCTGSWGTLGIITSVSARLFPLPAADATLVLEAPSAEDLVSAARVTALSPLPLSAIELVDPLPGEEGRSGLVIRLQGSRPQVEEMESGLRRELDCEGKGTGRWGRGLRRMEGEEGRVLHQGLEDWEAGAGLVLRLALLPSRLGTLVEEARDLTYLPSGPGRIDRTTVRISAHVGAGILRVAIGTVPEQEGLLVRWVGALLALRERLERAGGGLTVSEGPPGLVRNLGAWGRAGAEAAILSGLKEQFDPRGILVPGRMLAAVP